MTKEPNNNKSHYIKIPSTNCCIARELSFNGLSHLEIREAVGRTRYWMTHLAHFMRFYRGIIAAEAGEITLRDGANKKLSTQEVNGLYERFVLGQQGGIWTHLDAYFTKGSGYKGLAIETEHRSIREGNSIRNSYLVSPLEKCIEDTALVTFEVNEQGLSIKKSEEPILVRGKNIWYWPPIQNYTAGFGADARGAFLGCYWVPCGSYTALGALVCAEGAREAP